MYEQSEESLDYVRARENYQVQFANSFIHLTGLNINSDQAEGYLHDMQLANRMAVIKARQEDEISPLPEDNIINQFLSFVYKTKVHPKSLAFTRTGLSVLITAEEESYNFLGDGRIGSEGLGLVSDWLDLDVLGGSTSMDVEDKGYVVTGYASNVVIDSFTDLLKEVTHKFRTNLEIIQVQNCPPFRKILD